MSNLKKSSRRSDDAMDDDSDEKDSKRKSRNLSEKKRRDQFNLLVNELSSMVSTGGRKMDKSTILKSTISFLKNHNEIAHRSRANEIQEDWKPSYLTNEEFTHLVLEAVDGFIVVFSANGQIYYASESLTSLLGHLPADIVGGTIFDLAFEEEQNHLYNILMGPNEKECQVTFSCHLRRGGIDSKKNLYELVKFVGYFRPNTDMVQVDSNRYSGYSGEGDSRLVFIGTGKVQTPQLIREMPLVDSSKSEFTSRHSLEWKFLFLDHRAPPIIGYLPFELLGTSGYEYYHIDDLEDVIMCHEALMQKGEGTSCYYRFLTKGQQWIWLQTRFYISYHQWNSKPEFIVCTHRVVSYIDVMKQMGERNCKLDATKEAASVESNSSWPNKNSKEMELSPKCVSMSADSPTSALAQSTTPKSSTHEKLINAPTQSPQQTTFMESTPYVAAIPVQPVITGFASAILSPLTPVENVTMTTAQTQLQADLQRKHAELQAIIGQQQAELRRVSEQLLMARLGMLPTTQQNINATVGYSCNNTTSVSSTTTSGVSMPPTTAVLVPTTIPITIPMMQQQTNVFPLPDSNTAQK